MKLRNMMMQKEATKLFSFGSPADYQTHIIMSPKIKSDQLLTCTVHSLIYSKFAHYYLLSGCQPNCQRKR